MQERCPYCGGYLSIKPFYKFHREVGTFKVWICPNCKKEVKKWITNS